MPTIVAEALVGVADPLATTLRAPAAAAAPAVLRRLARLRDAPELAHAAPEWLWPSHHAIYWRLLAALERHGGALLADPAGSGKSFVALAVAQAMNGTVPTVCLAPAALLPQWRELSARLGVPLVLSSFERASRGGLPAAPAALVVIDESHHFRHTGIARYRHLAAWLIDRRALLLTATPSVNRCSDLAAQLLLAVRDDALTDIGVPSLRAALAGAEPPSVVGRLVFQAPPPAPDADPRPACRHRVVSPVEHPALAVLVDSIDRLRLSTDPVLAALLRGNLWRALASSPAALLGAARRARRLLRHGQDAAAAGRRLDRGALRRAIGGQDDQLIFWALLDGRDDPAALDLTDLAPLDALERTAAAATAGADPKIAALATILADRRPTLVFTTRRDTLQHLRSRLDDPALAWCAGDRAGIGRASTEREAVLGWFRAAGAVLPAGAPGTLLCTDVAAEGLDLRRIVRVVHYDLPWTAMRVEQREGRARRAGTRHGAVDVIELRAPPVIEERLHQLATLARKAALPERLGLGATAPAPWCRRAAAAERCGRGDASSGVAALRWREAGALVGFALTADGAGADVIWVSANGEVSIDDSLVDERLAVATEALAADGGALAPRPEEVRRAVSAAAPLIGARLRMAASTAWASPAPEAAPLVARLQALSRAAARLRDDALLRQIERALRFAVRGHTAGEAAMVRALALADDGALRRALPRMPDGVTPVHRALVVAVLVFRGPG